MKLQRRVLQKNSYKKQHVNCVKKLLVFVLDLISKKPTLIDMCVEITLKFETMQTSKKAKVQGQVYIFALKYNTPRAHRTIVSNFKVYLNAY